MGQLLEEVFRRYEQGHRLHAAMIELTHACCCRCDHCFLVREPKDELTPAEVLDLLDQLRREGVVNLALTGGEPFLRRDLPQILAAARRHRFFLSVLTTGITVGEPETDLMTRHGVQRVEVSLLGAGPDTHDAIMHFPGAFERTMKAVRLMIGAGLQVRLKTTILKPNLAEVPAMKEIADRAGALFEANASVAPRVDGDPSVLALSLDETDLVSLDPRYLTGGLIPDEVPGGGAVLVCRAGRTVAGFGPRGEVYPCLLFRRELGNLRERSLREILHEAPIPFLEELRRLQPAEVTACLGCEMRGHCHRCPGIAYQETADLRAASPSACRLARGLQARQVKEKEK